MQATRPFRVWRGSALCAFHLLFGGDQLTVERATGTKELNDNEWRGLDRLEGLLLVVEDWQAKVCLLKVRPLYY